MNLKDPENVLFGVPGYYAAAVSALSRNCDRVSCPLSALPES